MDKLNWTQEQIDDVANSGDCEDVDFIELAEDWMTMYKEIERLERINEVLNSTIHEIY